MVWRRLGFSFFSNGFYDNFTSVSGVLQRNIKESLLLSRLSNLITRFRNNKSQWVPLDSKFLVVLQRLLFLPVGLFAAGIPDFSITIALCRQSHFHFHFYFLDLIE